ncbi:MAG: hypothetical protein PHH93_07850 [Prolixibacteraceae bacterium]|nr:hypothetical protein [Prolixibacteraceae bacterium]
MKQEKNKEPEKEKENTQNKTKDWIAKAEKFIDDTTEKIHNSETYRKADKSVEKATKKIFRQAGRLWGKSKRYMNDRNDDKKDDI